MEERSPQLRHGFGKRVVQFKRPICRRLCAFPPRSDVGGESARGVRKGLGAFNVARAFDGYSSATGRWPWCVAVAELTGGALRCYHRPETELAVGQAHEYRGRAAVNR